MHTERAGNRNRELTPREGVGRQRNPSLCRRIMADMPDDIVFLIAKYLPDVEKWYLLAIFPNTPYVLEEQYEAVLKVSALPELWAQRVFYVRQAPNNDQEVTISWWENYAIKHKTLPLNTVTYLNAFMRSAATCSSTSGLFSEIVLHCRPKSIANEYIKRGVENSLSTQSLFPHLRPYQLPGFGLVEQYIELASSNIFFVKFIVEYVLGQLQGCSGLLSLALEDLEDHLVQLPLDDDVYSRALECFEAGKAQTNCFLNYVRNESKFLFRWCQTKCAPLRIEEARKDSASAADSILQYAAFFETNTLKPFQQRLEQSKKPSAPAAPVKPSAPAAPVKRESASKLSSCTIC